MDGMMQNVIIYLTEPAALKAYRKLQLSPGFNRLPLKFKIL